MHETLKELSAELAVLHESLERAEVIERQLPTYLREIEAERDEAIAERDQLRAEVNRLQGYNESLLQERDSRITTVAGLRRALEEIRAAVTTSTGQCGVLGTNWAECDYCGAVSQERMTPIPHEKGCAFAVSTAALTATSDAHERRIKSEALKQAAEEVYNRLNAKGAHSGARRQGWEAGLVDFADYLKAEADRLEAANGR